MLTGDDLKRFSEPVRHYVRRACCQSLVDFLRGDPCGRVFILYGLKHTGKTTMIRQCIGGMTDVERSQTALIRAREQESGTVFLAKWNDRRSSWNG